MQDSSLRPEAAIRFSVIHRLLHLVVMIGFTGLAVTGLSLGLSTTAPARAFMWLIGGPSHAAWLHRFCAIITYACVVIHAGWFLYYKFCLAGVWTGPGSPSKKSRWWPCARPADTGGPSRGRRSPVSAAATVTSNCFQAGSWTFFP